MKITIKMPTDDEPDAEYQQRMHHNSEQLAGIMHGLPNYEVGLLAAHLMAGVLVGCSGEKECSIMLRAWMNVMQDTLNQKHDGKRITLN